jgi:hypothetical protein
MMSLWDLPLESTRSLVKCESPSGISLMGEPTVREDLRMYDPGFLGSSQHKLNIIAYNK